MSTNEPAQKWTERNAAALALVDRLPLGIERDIEIGRDMVWIYSSEPSESAAIDAFVAEHAPDSDVTRHKPTANGRQQCTVEFADGVFLGWFRTVTVRIVEDDQP